MSIGNSKEIIDTAVQICREASHRLVDEGYSAGDADAKVKQNFERVNNDPNLVLTVEELCK